jgi:uncharacterized protein YggE
MSRICPLLLALTLSIVAQLPAEPIAAGSIQASGSASISVQPDQATLTAGVVTQATTAQDAATQNATMTSAMIKALTGVLGTKGTIQTIYYSLSPRYSNGSTNQPPAIIGYTASNTVQVVTNDLNLVGPLIDAANQAGGNNIGGPTFGLQNPEPTRQQALAAASKQALAHASAIASGLGAKIGSVISAQEGSNVTPIVAGAPTAAAGTPIQTGTVNVSATVTVTVAMVQ